jgi:hypothetical protein
MAARRAIPSIATAPTKARARPLALAAAAFIAALVGIGAGAAVTAYAVRQDAIGAVRAGPWRLLADAGTTDINPYLRAHYARTGQVPLVLAQGVMALADRDSAGTPLDGRCRYRVTGPVPPSLFWTLAAVDRHGMPLDNPAGRHAFSTEEVVRDVEGRFTIAVAAEVQPGNWLPVTGSGPFSLVLRLYQTRLSEPAGSGSRGYPMPRIETGPCG